MFTLSKTSDFALWYLHRNQPHSGFYPAFRSQIFLCASCHSVTQRIHQKHPPPIRALLELSDTDYSDSSCWTLPATTCLFWSLPPQRSDSERWGSMWLCRRCAMETSNTSCSSGSQRGALRPDHSPGVELHVRAGKRASSESNRGD